ncbi:MAG: hypothetical protein IAF08_12775 [Rhizobacter sp.]|nr:hypothetical protein [Chlorobiales bacterium]
MNTPVWLIVISALSFVNSVIFTFVLWRDNYVLLRSTARQEHNRLLLEIDKYLVDSPDLWAMWDEHGAQSNLSPEHQMKIRQFVYLVMNVYETVFDFYHHLVRRNAADEAHWTKWHNIITEFLRTSAFAREVVADVKTRRNYSEGFITYLDRIVASVQAGQKKDEKT